MTQPFAIVFPGQGSQAVGMLGDIAAKHSSIQETFQEASTALNYDLWALTQLGPAEKLNQTKYTQPALLTASVALWRLWLSKQEERKDHEDRSSSVHLPKLFAGHSLGEYSALVCANALSLSEAVCLVALRGQLMQAAVPEGQGAMAAILGLDDETVRAVCEAALDDGPGNEVLSPANYNTIGQVVIAGHTAAVLRVMEIAKARGAKRAIQLPVSVPSHCELMRPAAHDLAKALQNIPLKSPTIPVIHNVDVLMHNDPEAIRQALVNQLYKPVRWVETIRFIASQNVNSVLECGPGAVLSGLNKRIVEGLQCQSLSVSNGEAICP